MTNLSDFFDRICNSFKFFENFCRFIGFSSLKSGGTFSRVSMGYCIVSNCNGMIFKI